jgi:glycerophosphoryl diester phosphodiesterase
MSMAHQSTRTRPGYSARRVASCFTATVALVAVLAIDHTAATVHASQPLGSARLNDGLPLTIAHRGDPVDAPENTVPALVAALASGADIVEFDVQLTADGHAVIVHDDVLDRTTNGRGAIAEHTLAQLRALDAGSWYGSAWAGTGIPTLTEFLPLLQSSAARALIELKGVWNAEGLEPVAAQIYRYGLQDRVVIASFEEDTLMELWRTAPSLSRAAVVRRLPADPVYFAERVGATTVVTSLRSFEVEPHAVAALHEAGITVVVYTLNNPRLWQRAIDLGVDAVVTDAPRRHANWQPAPAEG